MNPYPTATVTSAASPTPANAADKTSRISSDSSKSATAKPQAHGSLNTFDDLLRQHSGMLHRLAAHYAEVWGVPIEDMLQEGMLGILDAIPRFDQSRARFLTYAVYWMRQRMTRHACATAFTVRPPYPSQWESRRCPVDMEHPDALGDLACDKWDELLSAEPENESALDLLDWLQQVLDTQERDAIHLIYWDGLKHFEVAHAMGFSRQRAQQIHAKAIHKMRLRLMKSDKREEILA